jgi:hypothetical protein
MPKPGKTLVSLDAAPYYHCSSRCVRRAFLCGQDAVTSQSFENKKQDIHIFNFKSLVGSIYKVKAVCEALGQQ